MPTIEEMRTRIREVFPDIPDEILIGSEHMMYNVIHVLNKMETKFGFKMTSAQKHFAVAVSLVTMQMVIENQTVDAVEPKKQSDSIINRMMHIEIE